MTLNGVMTVILRYFSEFRYLRGAVRKSSRSLCHFLISSCYCCHVFMFLAFLLLFERFYIHVFNELSNYAYSCAAGGDRSHPSYPVLRNKGVR